MEPGTWTEVFWLQVPRFSYSSRDWIKTHTWPQWAAPAPYLVLFFLPEHMETALPSFHTVRQGHVTDSGQWSVSGSDKCHSRLKQRRALLWLISCLFRSEVIIKQDRCSLLGSHRRSILNLKSPHGGRLPWRITPTCTEACASEQSSFVSNYWDLGSVCYCSLA